MQPRMQMTSIDVIASALEPVTPALSRMSSPDGAVTLMLSDIADANAAAEQLGAERWEQLLRDHHLLVERLVAGHDGQVMKFAAGPAEQRSLGIRVGLHSGFVMGNPEQLLGRNVVLASRIAGQAKGGEILVSSTAKEYTQTDPSFRFEEHGEYHFKGLLGEHVVYSLIWR